MRYRVNSPQVISETIDGETIIIHLGTGTYYSCQDGAVVWDAITESASAAEIADDLGRRYVADPSMIEAAVATLIGELQREELIVVSEAAARTGQQSAEPDAASREEFRAPKLTKYTDMQDLVLLDPVHEVGQAGWPQPKAEA